MSTPTVIGKPVSAVAQQSPDLTHEEPPNGVLRNLIGLKFRIISEADPGEPVRHARSARLPHNGRINTVVTAQELRHAVRNALHPASIHFGRRIISVEEIHGGFRCTVDQLRDFIAQTLRKPREYDSELALIADTSLDDSIWSFATQDSSEQQEMIIAVTSLLREHLIPGVTIAVLTDGSYDPTPHVQVEVFDVEQELYLSKFVELSSLTVDPEAVGLDAVAAIAKAIVDISDSLH